VTEDRNSYRSITKAIGLFGGVKVFQIIISIIKNKFLAVLLGPIGMGISGMITSTTGLISSLTGFGLQTSSVREISQAYTSNDTEKISTKVSVLRKLVLFSGLLGSFVTFLFARNLSIWSFGNEDYTSSFKIVSVILFFDQLCIGQTVLMQGTFNYKYMAKASMLGSLIGLFLTVPMYYFWKLKAIVPVIIVTSLINLLLSWRYSRKIPIENIKLSARQIISKGKIMLTLGIAIALTGVINTGQVYILRLYIFHYGNIADVGLYTAGIAIATSYIGVVLNAMASDFSPRLSAVASNNKLFTQTINRQMVLLITILGPLIITFVVFIKQLTLLLYSNKFIEITGMIEWIMLGMFLRAISWCLSYGFIAKGNSKLFFWNELVASLYSLLFSILGYKFYRFTGMGIGFCMTYLLYSAQVYIICRKSFNYKLNRDFYKIVLPQILISFLFFFIIKLSGYNVFRYLIGCTEIFIITYITYKQLDKIIDIRTILVSLKSKIRT